MIIRQAQITDLPEITKIYNEAILKTVATFDTEPKCLTEQEEWFREHGDTNPILVAAMHGEIIGWASLSRWSDRCAYSDTAEISLYISEYHQGKGFGRQLMKCILEKGQQAGLHTVIARIAEGNDISVHLHESVGFRHVGIMKEVGRKFGRLIDVHMMQLIYEGGSPGTSNGILP
ncbi:MAG: N-acetyltransferase [candidate division WOR-3 bacterium]|nr:MAG: N-acetyltransferase [candidate division WOR-3 bacterium]